MSLIDELNKPQYAGLTPAEKLSLVRAVAISSGHMIPATTVNQLFAQLDLTGVIADAAADVNHLARHKLASVIMSIGGNHDFNFIQGTVAGDGNLAMLDWMINESMTTYAAKLTAFKNNVKALANKVTTPLSNVQLVDITTGWSEVADLSSNRLRLHLAEQLPAPSMIRIEMSESEDGEVWTGYKRVNHFYNVQNPDFYFAAIPNNGLQRRVRVRSELHAFSGVVKAA